MVTASHEDFPSEPFDDLGHGVDPGVEARRRALEDGSGWSPYYAQIATNPDPQISGAQDLPRWPRPPKKPRKQTTSGPDADSYTDPNWGLPHRPDMNSEEKKVHRRGVVVLRTVLAAANKAVSRQNAIAKPWQAPEKVVSDLRELQVGLQAGFLPDSHSEKRAAIEYIPLLNPHREGPSGIPAHLNNLSARIGNSRGLEVAAKFRQSKQVEAATYLGDAKTSQLLFAQLSALFEAKGAHGTFKSFLEHVPQEKSSDIARVVVRYFCLDEIVRTGKASIGLDPLRTKKASTSDPTTALSENDNPRVKVYTDDLFARLSAVDVKELLPFMHRLQTNRMQFWNRILQEMGEEGRQVASGILNKYATK